MVKSLQAGETVIMTPVDIAIETAALAQLDKYDEEIQIEYDLIKMTEKWQNYNEEETAQKIADVTKKVEENKEFELPLFAEEKGITKKLFNRYASLAGKVWVSHSDLFCYLFMFICVFRTGGILYIVYPFMIFGKAMIHENRPGKTFWFIILVFTQVMILGNFVI